MNKKMRAKRNDPCPCGSEKKYKKCCMGNDETSSDDFKKRRWAKVQSALVAKIMEHTVNTYGEVAYEEALSDFYCLDLESGEMPEMKDSDSYIFTPWFLYEWFPEPEFTQCKFKKEMPPAEALAKRDKTLSKEELDYLKACYKSSFSFFEVLEVEPHKSIKLKDILRETTHLVLEKSASASVKEADILFGKVLGIDGIEILEACAPIVIPPLFKIELLNLRKNLKAINPIIDNEILHVYALEVIQTYQYIYKSLHNDNPPTMTNFEEHLVIPHKLIYEIKNADLAFECLHSLNISETKEDLLKDASYDKNNGLKKIAFDWLKKLNKEPHKNKIIIIGNITIDDTKMTVEVNSKERANRFKAQIKKRMPANTWKLKASLIEPLEAKLKEENNLSSFEKEQEDDDFKQDPEYIKVMEQVTKKHWEEWLTQRIPLLGNKSPLQAKKTKDGKEALEALLNDFERRAEANPQPWQNVNTIKELRKKLNL